MQKSSHVIRMLSLSKVQYGNLFLCKIVRNVEILDWEYYYDSFLFCPIGHFS